MFAECLGILRKGRGGGLHVHLDLGEEQFTAQTMAHGDLEQRPLGTGINRTRTNRNMGRRERTNRNTDQQVSQVSLDRQECMAGWGVDKDTLCTPPLLLMATFFITSRMWMHKYVGASACTYM
jgi:hypothetical protein